MTRTPQEIAALLRRPTAAGVYSIPRVDSDAFARVAPEMQLHLVELELDGCVDKASLLKRLSSAYRLPDWFGFNWDALADALGDLSWLPSDGYLTVVRGIGTLPRSADADVRTLLEILRETAGDWTADGIPFWILIEDGTSDIAPPPPHG